MLPPDSERAEIVTPDPSAPVLPARVAPVTAGGSTPLDPATPTAPPAPVPAPGTRGDPDAPASGLRPSRTAFIVALGLVLVLAGGALFWSGYALGQRTAVQPGTPAGEDEAFQPFWDAYRAVVDRYAGGPIDRQDLIDGAIRGMVGAIGDPYSTYLSPDDYQQALEDLSGQFEGVGAEIGTRKPDGSPTNCSTLAADCRLTVIAPIDGSPAQKAGIRAGDQVLAVDGASLNGLTVDGARDRIRGKKGTTVVLTIVRTQGAPFDLSIVRDVIVSKEVTSRDLAGGTIGYIRLSGFSAGGASDVVSALTEDIAAGRMKIIIDLRGNPGGFVDAARKVASQFVKDEPIFWQEDSKGTQTPTQALADGVATNPAIKIVLLIDKGSASASEIVAGALQDLDRATLIGETSYGKGTVQQWTELGSGGAGLKLTVARWLTPDKRWIHNVGVVPDIQVKVPADLPAGSDPALDRAIELLGGSAGASSIDQQLLRSAA